MRDEWFERLHGYCHAMAQARLLLEEELINEIEFVQWEQHCAQIWGWPERSIYRQCSVEIYFSAHRDHCRQLYDDSDDLWLGGL